MKVLVTGFDPFDGEKINPAFEAVKLLLEKIADTEIIKLEIPTAFKRSEAAVRRAILKYRPDIIINVGQAGGRDAITPEKVAINYADASIPDNDGEAPYDMPLKENGKNAYFATVPVKAMVDNMLMHGIRAKLSFTAGTYVCNAVMYNTQYMIENEFPEIREGFIHVPYCESQVSDKKDGTPFMSLSEIAEGLKYAIEAAVAGV